MNKCDKCQQQFSCTAEDGNCDEGKEKFIPLEEDFDFEALNFRENNDVQGA